MDADQIASQSDSSSPAFDAPSHCPQFPAMLATSTVPVFAGTASPGTEPAPLVFTFSPGATRNTARTGQFRTQTDRGPPSAA